MLLKYKTNALISGWPQSSLCLCFEGRTILPVFTFIRNVLIFKESLGDLQDKAAAELILWINPDSAIGATPGCALRGLKPKPACGSFCGPLGCVNGISHLLPGCDKWEELLLRTLAQGALALVPLGALARAWSELGQLRSSMKKWNKIIFSCDLSLYNKPKTSSVVLCCQCHQLSVLPVLVLVGILGIPRVWFECLRRLWFFGRCLARVGWVSSCSPAAQQLPGIGCAALSIPVWEFPGTLLLVPGSPTLRRETQRWWLDLPAEHLRHQSSNNNISESLISNQTHFKVTGEQCFTF